jgi:DNA polymerase I
MLRRLLRAARHPTTISRMRSGYAALNRLPYRRLVVLDTEFRADGDPHRCWCVCGVELRSGKEYRLWTDGYDGPLPFPLDETTLVIAFVAGAETASLLAKGCGLPPRIFDLFQEFRLVTNTGQHSDPRSLESACAYYGIAVIDHAAKQASRDEAQQRVSWPDDRKRALVEYCFSDALATAALFVCTLPDWLDVHEGEEERGLFFALRRGRVAGVMAEAELRGIPFNLSDWHDLENGREYIFTGLVNELPPDLRRIYRNTREGPVFTVAEFEATMAERRLADEWPRTATGRLLTTSDVLRAMLRPAGLGQLEEVMTIRSRYALLQCAVGRDGRARAPFFPGSTAKRSRLQSTKRRDGWVVLTTADLQKLGLGDRKARQRTIHRAAQQGWLEVRRSDGRQSKYAYRLCPGTGLPGVVNLDEERERR